MILRNTHGRLSTMETLNLEANRIISIYCRNYSNRGIIYDPKIELAYK